MPKRKAKQEPEEGSDADNYYDSDGEAQNDEAFAKSKSKPAKGGVNPKRVRELNKGTVGKGPVIYWMSRDQRSRDNWALLHACEVAKQQGTGVAVAFNLVPAFLGAGARQFGFMLRGLQKLEPALKKLDIPFFLLKGEPKDTIPKLVKDCKAGLLVTEQSPMRIGRQWRDEVAKAVGSVAFHEVDAHNVVPVWVVSNKREYGARTIRTKVHKHLPEFLKEYPMLEKPPKWDGPQPEGVDWEALIAEVVERGKGVPEIDWATPGQEEGWEALQDFIKRMKGYHQNRNNPTLNALSNLSPYFHYGQLSVQAAALELAKHKAKLRTEVDAFLEEAVVRRELSDNYCFYSPDDYDSLDACADWAKESLQKHASDEREHIYTREQLEKAETHDELWNAAQNEMVHYGKMHGFMRMYWAKKILEWTPSPEEALDIAIQQNDKFEIDGRDPNGYVGCMWAIGGIHDQGWSERPVFGKIRYMNYNGCKRKFNVAGYVQKIDDMMAKIKK